MSIIRKILNLFRKKQISNHHSLVNIMDAHSQLEKILGFIRKKRIDEGRYCQTSTLPSDIIHEYNIDRASRAFNIFSELNYLYQNNTTKNEN